MLLTVVVSDAEEVCDPGPGDGDLGVGCDHIPTHIQHIVDGENVVGSVGPMRVGCVQGQADAYGGVVGDRTDADT